MHWPKLCMELSLTGLYCRYKLIICTVTGIDMHSLILYNFVDRKDTCWKGRRFGGFDPFFKKCAVFWNRGWSFISWWKQYLTHSLGSFVKYCFHHSKITYISSHHSVILIGLRINLYVALIRAQHKKLDFTWDKKNINFT